MYTDKISEFSVIDHKLLISIVFPFEIGSRDRSLVLVGDPKFSKPTIVQRISFYFVKILLFETKKWWTISTMPLPVDTKTRKPLRLLKSPIYKALSVVIISL